MFFLDNVTQTLYQQLADLEDKLQKSELERRDLESKFVQLSNVARNEELQRMSILKEKYNQFLKDCDERSQRNEVILKSLQKLENGASAVFAKTERLKQLRVHYEAYLSRVIPLWRHPQSTPSQWTQQLPDQLQHLAWIQHGRKHINGSSTNPPSHVTDLPDSWKRERHINDSSEMKYGLTPRRSGIESLGLAGQRMIEELKKDDRYPMYANWQQPESLENFTSIDANSRLPEFRSSAGPKPEFCGTPALNKVSTYGIKPYYNSSESEPSAFRPVSAVADNHNSNVQRGWYKIRDGPAFLKEFKYAQMPEKSLKENFEIECLTTDTNQMEDDQNLSDDEVLDSSMYQKLQVIRSNSGILPAEIITRRNELIEPRQGSQIDSTLSLKEPTREYDERKKSPPRENYFESERSPVVSNPEIVDPVTKKSIIVHQKSIEELKAILSFEEDEEPVEPPGQYPPSSEFHNDDEDIPEEFTEETPIEQRYDPRHEGDVLRNVILEEDEPEEHDNERLIENRYKRKDWGRIQYHREKGNLPKAQLGNNNVLTNIVRQMERFKESKQPEQTLPTTNSEEDHSSRVSPIDQIKALIRKEKSFSQSESARSSPTNAASRTSSPKSDGRKSTSPVKQPSRESKSRQSPSVSPSSSQKSLRQGRASPLQHTPTKQQLIQKVDLKRSPLSSQPPSVRSSPQHKPTEEVIVERQQSSRTQSPQLSLLSQQSSPARGIAYSEIPYEEVSRSIDEWGAQRQPSMEHGLQESEQSEMRPPGPENAEQFVEQSQSVLYNSQPEYYNASVEQPAYEQYDYPQQPNYAEPEFQQVDNPVEEVQNYYDNSNGGYQNHEESNVYGNYNEYSQPQQLHHENVNYNEQQYQQGEYEQQQYEQQYPDQQMPADEYRADDSGINQVTSYQPQEYQQYDEPPQDYQQEYTEQGQTDLYDNRFEQTAVEQGQNNPYATEDPGQYDPNYYHEQQIPQDFEQGYSNYGNNQEQYGEQHIEGDAKQTGQSVEPPKPSVLSQLLDSDSESYRVEPAGTVQDDSDFDFSIGKQ